MMTSSSSSSSSPPPPTLTSLLKSTQIPPPQIITSIDPSSISFPLCSSSTVGSTSSLCTVPKLLAPLHVTCQVTDPTSKATLQALAELLHQEQVVAIPTETVYGLAAIGTSAQAVDRIYEYKQRPRDNPLILHVSSLSMLHSYYPLHTIPTHVQTLLNHCWPGPLTLIVPAHPSIATNVTCGLPTMGLRMPSHPFARALIEVTGQPLAAPSANLSGRPSPTCAIHVQQDFMDRGLCILEGGVCKEGLESTVVLVSDPPIVLRPGPYGSHELSRLPGWESLVVASTPSRSISINSNGNSSSSSSSSSSTPTPMNTSTLLHDPDANSTLASTMNTTAPSCVKDSSHHLDSFTTSDSKESNSSHMSHSLTTTTTTTTEKDVTSTLASPSHVLNDVKLPTEFQPLSPGMKYIHYSPKVPVHVITTPELLDKYLDFYLLASSPSLNTSISTPPHSSLALLLLQPYSIPHRFLPLFQSHILDISSSPGPWLFHGLRSLDQPKVKVMLVLNLPTTTAPSSSFPSTFSASHSNVSSLTPFTGYDYEKGNTMAVMNRLSKAAHYWIDSMEVLNQVLNDLKR